MDRIRAPYNFVPLSKKVVFPEWGNIPAQDVPFADGVSGTLRIEITAHTPIFVRGSERSDKFYQLDGKFAVPGSALRGMLRNVVEIAGFGKLNRYNDHRYGVRDLNNRALYQEHMAAIMAPDGGGQQEPMPLVDAGWLRRSSEGEVAAHIEPCDFAKIHYRELIDLAEARGIAKFNPGAPRQGSAEKYAAWGSVDGAESHRAVKVDVTNLRPREYREHLPFLSAFGKAKISSTSGRPGVLVFTGQPGEWPLKPKAKHHDFVFFESVPGTPKIPVPLEVMEAFTFIHSDRGQQDRSSEHSPNKEWEFWRPAFKRGDRVPVFFLRWQSDQGKDGRCPGDLRAFGLAQMFRLAYDHSVRDGVVNAQPDSEKPDADLAQLIFGDVAQKEHASPRARRGRVSVGLLKALGSPREAPEVSLILGAPKASYYPNYIEQGDGYGDRPVGGGYRSFMDEGVRVRGWKRYRPHSKTQSQPQGRGRSDKVATRFAPLAEATKFEGKIRLHNLRPEELGALLWALDFGGHEQAFHTLGLARSFGYGRIQIRLSSCDLRTNNGTAPGLPVEYVTRFTKYMDAKLDTSWASTFQIRDLLALTQIIPIDALDYEGRHMEITHRDHGNEFQKAKEPELSLALPPVGRDQGTATSIHAVSPRSPSSESRAKVQPTNHPSMENRVKVRLLGQSDRVWRAELVTGSGKGTISEGIAPRGAAKGLVYAVIVTRDDDRTRMKFKWPPSGR